ncbi:polysaccharide deacetylase family protein [Halomonas sp. THAF12]|uniref:polysaccharide deacetylase family protein n=1 Tax=Halomonas sp. B23F22_10 TaxID=3459515 RepID=UPI00373FBF1D
MSQQLTIVMYHYVRPLRGTRYPTLKALELERFRGQLDFIQRHYRVVSMEEAIAASRGDIRLPERALLLTFDDGYRDHHEHVLPLLAARGWKGSFFPPVCAVREGRVLDVNKIHFVLASGVDERRLVDEILTELEAHRDDHDLPDRGELFAAYSRESRYDGPEVTFIKRILQKGLPRALREPLIDRLFKRFVTEDERGFAGELYMGEGELKELHAAGMTIGSHGDRHQWLNTLTPQQQQREIDNSLAFLTNLGVPAQDWVMCYPFGGYDDGLLQLLRARQCALALTVEVGIADLAHQDPLRLPRLDTNDLPVAADAPPGHWTLSAGALSS